jgi:ribosomal protein S3
VSRITIDAESRARLESLARVYEGVLPKVLESQAKGVAALQNSVENYEKLKVKVEVLNAQIDVSRTLASTASDFDIGSSSREIDELIDSLEKDLDLAEASFEVESLGIELR